MLVIRAKLTKRVILYSTTAFRFNCHSSVHTNSFSSLKLPLSYLSQRVFFHSSALHEDEKKEPQLDSTVDNNGTDDIKSKEPLSQFRSNLDTEGFGVFNLSEKDDVDVLVQNYTAPALAKALRHRESLLHIAAQLVKDRDFDAVSSLLQPFLR